MDKKEVIKIIEERIQELQFQQTIRKMTSYNTIFKHNTYIEDTIINELENLLRQINNINNDNNNTLSSSINKNNNQYTTEEVIAELYKDKSKIFKRVNDENFIIYRGNYGDIMMKIKDIIIKPLPIFNYYQDLWIEIKGDDINELSNSCYLNNR